MDSSDLGRAILDRLMSVSQKGEKRIDAYVETLWDTLKETQEWTSAHDIVFKEMVSEVKAARFKSMLSFVIAIAVSAFTVYYSFVIVPNQKEALADRITEANMPVRFSQSASGANQMMVEYDQSDFTADQQDLFGELALHRVGVYAGLGSDAFLSFAATDEPLTWDVSPRGRSDEIIGKLRVSNTPGTLERVELDRLDAVGHNGLSGVYVRVAGVPSSWTAVEAGPVDYEIEYGVDAGDGIVWSDPVTIRSSTDGEIFRGPFPVYHPDWNHLYIVVAAAGHWGVDRDGDGRSIVYNFKSIVREIKFN